MLRTLTFADQHRKEFLEPLHVLHPADDQSHDENSSHHPSLLSSNTDPPLNADPDSSDNSSSSSSSSDDSDDSDNPPDPPKLTGVAPPLTGVNNTDRDNDDTIRQKPISIPDDDDNNNNDDDDDNKLDSDGIAGVDEDDLDKNDRWIQSEIDTLDADGKLQTDLNDQYKSNI